jgi:hypothetical protein
MPSRYDAVQGVRLDVDRERTGAVDRGDIGDAGRLPVAPAAGRGRGVDVGRTLVGRLVDLEDPVQRQIDTTSAPDNLGSGNGPDWTYKREGGQMLLVTIPGG